KGFTFATHGKNLVSYNCLVAFRRLIAPGENQGAGHDDTTHKLQCMLHDIQRFVPPDTVKIRSLQKEKPGASAGLPVKSYTAQLLLGAKSNARYVHRRFDGCAAGFVNEVKGMK